MGRSVAEAGSLRDSGRELQGSPLGHLNGPAGHKRRRADLRRRYEGSQSLMEFTFGAVPHTDDDQTRVLLAEFCARWSKRSNVPVRPHRAPSPGSLQAAFHRDRVQLAWVSPGLFLLSDAFTSAVPLASAVREGDSRYNGVLFVRDASPIRRVESLRGSNVAWVAPTSAAGYLMPRLALVKQGLDPNELFASEVFLDTHGAVARCVAEGRADVGATHALFDDADPSRALRSAGFDRAEGLRARVVLASAPIPSDLIVASRAVPPWLRGNLAVALRDLTEDGSCTELFAALFGLEGYRDHQPAALGRLARDLSIARERGLWTA
ncbi:MAG: phosphate/phosphite/phosphonate ABC transporter substrate-binding protein [Nannocystaceae bacterium]|nr:phosphate/phosphite/phosphonate ABC transporter substrate-binding protein [Nannocystaceae bacterium]